MNGFGRFGEHFCIVQKRMGGEHGLQQFGGPAINRLEGVWNRNDFRRSMTSNDRLLSTASIFVG